MSEIFDKEVVPYDAQMKVLFHLKSGQKNELLLNLIFHDYPDGTDDGANKENSAKEKETAKAISLSGCAYTPVMVELMRVELMSE